MNAMPKLAAGVWTMLFLTGCNEDEPSVVESPTGGEMNVGTTLPELPVDAHSRSRPNEVRVQHARLDLTLDFAKKVVRGTVALEIQRIEQDAPLVVDTHSLDVSGVTGTDGKPRRYTLGAKNDLLGQSLSIELQPGDVEVTIAYETSSNSQALQWLTKEQTYSRRGEYVYTQGQAILTRSWIPLQDTPGVRMTYSATIHAPKEMRVVMSANVRGEAGAGVFTFAMDKPIPSYLIALACGHIEFAKLSERCGVFADPLFLESAKAEFADTEQMLQKCETAFGPYVWGRYDIIVLPPAFPFGGMENPTLTFATPTIVTGDKSLVALIAHELAHSWSGNLVTNATWRDFWLNEGFTVYLEQRIMELVYGRDRAELEIATGIAQLRREIAELPAADQHLYIDLTDRNPDDGMTAIAYDKGAAFLRRLEAVFGREVFDAFLNGYFQAHRFRSITTSQFLGYLDANLLKKHPDKAKTIDVKKWVFGPGLPATMAEVRPRAFAHVDAVRRDFLAKKQFPSDAKDSDWTYHEWLYFLDGLPSRTGTVPGELTADLVRALEEHGLLSTPNPEVRCRTLRLVLENGHHQYHMQAGEFLELIGRRKFVEPIFRALMKSEIGATHAREIFQRIRDRLHFITRDTVQKILDR